MKIKGFENEKPEVYNRVIQLVRAGVSINIEDFSILQEAGILELYIQVKELNDNLKLARLSELITGQKGLEKIVLTEELNGLSSAFGVAWLSGGQNG